MKLATPITCTEIKSDGAMLSLPHTSSCHYAEIIKHTNTFAFKEPYYIEVNFFRNK
jgi:hypothetical protein